MYKFYVLKSERTGEYYRGQTRDLIKRIQRHNRGDSRSTKAGRPWRLVHSEEYSTRAQAIERENFLKSPAGLREWQKIRRAIEDKVIR